MQPDQLRTLIAIRDSGSLSAAAQAVNLSHSAVSLQMKRLEDSLGRALLIKGKRPARLTPFGLRLAAQAAPVLCGLDALTRLAQPDSTAGEVAIGFVPTTLQTLLPVVLGRMQAQFPALSLRISSGLSGTLAGHVSDGRLDFAVLTAPETAPPGLRLDPIAEEPLCLIAPPGTALPADPLSVFATLPLVGFTRTTWLGQRIAALLQPLGRKPTIEIDAIDAVEHLVASGFGASVVPQRIFAPALSTRMACAPLPGAGRPLALASHPGDTRVTIRSALARAASPRG